MAIRRKNSTEYDYEVAGSCTYVKPVELNMGDWEDEEDKEEGDKEEGNKEAEDNEEEGEQKEATACLSICKSLPCTG